MMQIQAVLIRQHHLSALAMTQFRWRVFSLGMAGLLIMLLAACGSGSSSSGSSSDSSSGPTPAPAMPTGMVVTPGNNAVTVTWNTVAGVTSYNIYRSTSQGQQGTKVGASSTLSYVDSTALNGVTYYYEVTAANAAGEGPVSAQSTGVTPVMPITVPAPPTGVNAVGGSGQVTVTWTAATGSTSYNIYRSTSQGSQGTKIGASSTASYTDTTVVNGTTYYYEVTAANAAGESPTSTQSAPATPGAPAPAPPPSITTALGKPGRLLVGLGAANTFADMKTQQIAPDIIDTYLVAVTGFNSGGGNAWPQWQYNYPDGGVVTVFSSNVAAMGAVPMFTLFQMPSLRAGDVTVINDAPFMTAYWAQAKLMYQKIAATGLPTLVNLEPDFWGFAQGSAPGGDPAKLPARVSMVTECASQPDTAVGVVGCLLTLGRTYAPKARMGFPPSLWSGDANATGSFMAKLGADKADFIVAQTSDRDAGCFEVPTPVDECAGRGNGPFYLDENNITTPNFNQSLDQWSTVRSHLGGLPILFWQTPMGVPSTTPGGTPKHYRDNHVHYMLTHPTQYTGNGIFAIVFSPGGATSADITNDGGQFANLFRAYLANPAPFPP